MNPVIFSFLVTVTVLFHTVARSSVKKGRVREAFCSCWCVDAVFAVCGTLISFTLYHYDFVPWLTWRNLLWTLLFLIVTFLLFLLAPSGLSLFTNRAVSPSDDALSSEKANESFTIVHSSHHKKPFLKEGVLLAEYRFDNTLCMVRNFFLALLFGLPILMILVQKIHLPLPLFFTWSEAEMCGAFCFTAFLILLPISIRQTFFWLKHLQGTPEGEETQVLKQYRIRLHYKQKNRRL